MKLQQIKFNRPVKIFQVFRNINLYSKEEKSFELRKDKMAWQEMFSKSGFVKEGELHLPESILQNADFKTADLITMEDENSSQKASVSNKRIVNLLGIKSTYQAPLNHCFRLSRLNKLYSFEIRKKDEIELHLLNNYFTIGNPVRNNFKVGEIKKDKPLEVKINGKTDFSMTSRRARMYKEQYYIFHYLGDFEKCSLLKEPYPAFSKHIPEERKIVDLMKRLW